MPTTERTIKIKRYLGERPDIIQDIITTTDYKNISVVANTGTGKTTAFMEAGLALDEETVLVIAEPTKALAYQKGDLARGIMPVYKGFKAGAGSKAAKVFVAVYEKTLSLVQDLANEGKEVICIIDESHLQTQAYSYRRAALRTLDELNNYCSKVIDMTATDRAAKYTKEYDLIVRFDDEYSKTLNAKTQLIIFNKESLKEQYLTLIDQEAKRNDKLYVRINSKKTIEEFEDILTQKGYRVGKVYTDTDIEQQPTYQHIVNLSTFPSDIDIVLSTEKLDMGIDLKFDSGLKSSILYLPLDSGDISIESIIQVRKRIRTGIERYVIGVIEDSTVNCNELESIYENTFDICYKKLIEVTEDFNNKMKPYLDHVVKKFGYDEARKITDEYENNTDLATNEVIYKDFGIYFNGKLYPDLDLVQVFNIADREYHKELFNNPNQFAKVLEDSKLSDKIEVTYFNIEADADTKAAIQANKELQKETKKTQKAVVQHNLSELSKLDNRLINRIFNNEIIETEFNEFVELKEEVERIRPSIIAEIRTVIEKGYSGQKATQAFSKKLTAYKELIEQEQYIRFNQYYAKDKENPLIYDCTGGRTYKALREAVKEVVDIHNRKQIRLNETSLIQITNAYNKYIHAYNPKLQKDSSQIEKLIEKVFIVGTEQTEYTVRKFISRPKSNKDLG